MKKILSTLMVGALALTLAACGQASTEQKPAEGTNQGAQGGKEAVTLKVGATAVPHAEILNQVVKPLLEKENVQLEVVTFQDYVLPNTQLAEKELDANYFQHIPWLEQTNKEKNLNLTYAAGVHIEPMGVYSNKAKAYKDIASIPAGAKVAITNGQGEHGRVLALLEKAGLLKLKEGVGINGTIADIVEKKVELVELEPPMLPRALDDAAVDAAVINSNFALEAGLNPSKDSIFLESGENNPYVNVLAVRDDNKDSEGIKKLAKALTSPEVKDFIEKTYGGSVLFVGEVK